MYFKYGLFNVLMLTLAVTVDINRTLILTAILDCLLYHSITQ